MQEEQSRKDPRQAGKEASGTGAGTDGACPEDELRQFIRSALAAADHPDMTEEAAAGPARTADMGSAGDVDMAEHTDGGTLPLREALDSVLIFSAATELEAYKRRTGKDTVTFEEFQKEILPLCLEKAAGAGPEGGEQDPRPGTGQKPLTPKEIENLRSILPKKHVMPNSKVANMLPVMVTGGEQKQGFDVDVSSRGRMNTRVIVALDHDNGNITFSGRPYTEYDRSVMDAIISLWVYGDESHNITPSMVYRAMTNKTQSEYVSPQAVDAVTKSIEKMRHIFVRIDASDEFAKRGITDKNGDPVRARFNNYLLSVTEIEVSAGGRTVNAYHIDAEPILFMYSQMNNQYLTVNASLLDVKEVKDNKLTTVSLKNSERLIVIRDYLIRRIQAMKRGGGSKKIAQSNRILYETLYTETGIGDASKTVKLDARNKAHETLDFFRAKKFISDYETIKENGTYTAIDIIL